MPDGGAASRNAISLARAAARKRLSAAEAAKSTQVGVPAQHFDIGGAPQIPYFERGEIRNVADPIHPGGLVNSAGPGRTDIHNVSVASGSYVLPADVVSGLGEGNTLAGAKVIDSMLSSGPYGTRLPAARARSTIPRPPSPSHLGQSETSKFEPGSQHFASGGGSMQPIPIVIAGGEFVVNPDQVAKLGGGDVKRGHSILDEFVKHVRKKTVKTLKKLPGPVK